ncbi:uncharacterized protein LOC131159966 [Malania oleifera]|uniref:uncharacterized protein LOC131159966 n=1 Tax=Malania oleifera TaxID=397392 RepID=UPI0025ADD460|nr:uncharacterized protein LOC131159966 [Malania oleifera]XP_057971205.1 uncharacterized protein LOC131159966 [Malania oleifera]XP_057971206.1 uncharacterized protein LOC131159966 [Malania oleifera]
MEDEKKKKRNKKKKNKQKATEDSTAAVGEVVSVNQNHVVEQNHSQVSESAGVQIDAGIKTDGDLDRYRGDGNEGAIVDKGHWLQRAASLEETIKLLQNEKGSHIQKEADLEMRIAQLQREKDFWLQREASLEEKISQLLDEKASLGLKEASLEEKIKYLEREKESGLLKENITREMVASLNDDNARLRLQVTELEESQNNLLRENQQLMENMSGLQSHIHSLERINAAYPSSIEVGENASENEDRNSQKDASHAVVEKLVTENAELSEKVNELYVEPDGQNVPAAGSNQVVAPDLAQSVSDPRGRMSPSAERMEPLSVVSIKDERIDDNNIDMKPTAVLPYSLETVGSREILQNPAAGEIVPIPLNKNEVQDLGSQAAERDKKAAVPLSDAPLIGAPFRMISFVAKYVSGADLVNKGS